MNMMQNYPGWQPLVTRGRSAQACWHADGGCPFEHDCPWQLDSYAQVCREPSVHACARALGPRREQHCDRDMVGGGRQASRHLREPLGVLFAWPRPLFVAGLHLQEPELLQTGHGQRPAGPPPLVAAPEKKTLAILSALFSETAVIMSARRAHTHDVEEGPCDSGTKPVMQFRVVLCAADNQGKKNKCVELQVWIRGLFAHRILKIHALRAPGTSLARHGVKGTASILVRMHVFFA